MLIGDPALREEKRTTLQNCYRCFTGPNFRGDNSAPCADRVLDTRYMPKEPCLGGIRSNVEFPTYITAVPTKLGANTDQSTVAGMARTLTPRITRATLRMRLGILSVLAQRHTLYESRRYSSRLSGTLLASTISLFGQRMVLSRLFLALVIRRSWFSAKRLAYTYCI
jgi:hypothetical protein